MPKLIVQIPDGEEIAYEFDDPVVTIGRSDDNSIPIPHGSLSGQHARLTLNADGSYTLSDVGSTNGTFVNGEHVTEAVLPGYAGIVFGQVACAYYGSQDTPVPSAAPGYQLPELSGKGRPANFLPVSPVPRIRKKKDAVGSIASLLAVLSILGSVGLVAAIFLKLQ